jgi:hypothetical protein
MSWAEIEGQCLDITDNLLRREQIEKHETTNVEANWVTVVVFFGA